MKLKYKSFTSEHKIMRHYKLPQRYQFLTQSAIPPWARICNKNWKRLRESAALEGTMRCSISYTCKYKSIKYPWKTWVASPNTNLDENLSPLKLAKARKLVIPQNSQMTIYQMIKIHSLGCFMYFINFLSLLRFPIHPQAQANSN